MANLAQKLMTADEFLAFADGREGKWELHDGVPVCMSPERVGHSETKFNAAQALQAALRDATVECRVLIDGPLVRVNAHRSFQPDVLLYCGERHAADLLEVPNPLIVVEVLSPTTASIDLGDKLRGYFQVDSVMHYLILDPDQKLVVWHRRGQVDEIATRFVTAGEIRLDPPGIDFDVVALFAVE